MNQWHVECLETMTWISDKVHLIESTEDFGTDLGGVMKLQRRLSGLERDIAAIANRLQMLTAESSRLVEDRPEEAQAIKACEVTDFNFRRQRNTNSKRQKLLIYGRRMIDVELSF